MKILLTGGAGYIGSSLVPKLLEKKFKVCVLDNLMYDNGDNLMPYFHTSKFQFVKGDIRDKRLIKDLVHNFEYIIHLSAISGSAACNRNPELSKEVNIDSSKYLSSLLSNDQEILFFPTEPEVENVFLNNNNSVSYRFDSAFGLSPRMRLDLLVNNFVYQAVNNKSLFIFEKFTKKTYVHISDIVKSIVYFIENRDSIENNIYNIGSKSNNLDKEEIASIIKKKIDFNLYFSYPSEVQKQEDKLLFENNSINHPLNSKISVEDGINELIKFYTSINSRCKYKNV